MIAAIRRLSEEEARNDDGGSRRRSLDAAKAMASIRNFASCWTKAKPATKATMVQSPYEDLVVRGSEFVSVRLTPEAYAHGLALALSQRVLADGRRREGGSPPEARGARSRADLGPPSASYTAAEPPAAVLSGTPRQVSETTHRPNEQVSPQPSRHRRDDDTEPKLAPIEEQP